jgi:hypothetical protein
MMRLTSWPTINVRHILLGFFFAGTVDAQSATPTKLGNQNE